MRVRIENLHKGCENNALFLSRARRYFELNGHSIAGDAANADLILIGACVVTDAMRRNCEAAVSRWTQQIPTAQFVIFGCLAAFPEALQKAAANVCFIPYQSSSELDRLIGARIPYESVNASRLEQHIPYQPRMGPEDAYVLIAQGCVNDCSYCNIRKAKGRVHSRLEREIETEVRDLCRQNVRTITLLGDDCGSYGLDIGSDLPELLARLTSIAPDLNLKLYTVFPSLFLRFAARLEPFFAAKRVPYVCLPTQSAAPRILELMHRRYDPAQLAAAVDRMRALDPNVFVYSHFIFNFPTETWPEFEQSVHFARHFNHCVFIAYGENSTTQAALIAPKCTDAERVAKAQRLYDLVAQRQLAAFVVPQA